MRSSPSNIICIMFTNLDRIYPLHHLCINISRLIKKLIDKMNSCHMGIYFTKFIGSYQNFTYSHTTNPSFFSSNIKVPTSSINGKIV